MSKRKGFTLIELLAVLVILAIIALIITPIITNLIKDARIKSAEDATMGLVRSIETYYGREMMKSNGKFNDNQTKIIYFDGTKNASDNTDGDSLIEYNGFKVTQGEISITRYGEILTNGCSNKPLIINGYYCVYNDYFNDYKKTATCMEKSDFEELRDDGRCLN